MHNLGKWRYELEAGFEVNITNAYCLQFINILFYSLSIRSVKILKQTKLLCSAIKLPLFLKNWLKELKKDLFWLISMSGMEWIKYLIFRITGERIIFHCWI